MLVSTRTFRGDRKVRYLKTFLREKEMGIWDFYLIKTILMVIISRIGGTRSS